MKNKGKRQTQVLTVNGEVRPIRRRYTAEVAGAQGADEAEGGEGGKASERVTLTARSLATDDPDCHSQVTGGVRELMCRLTLNADSFADTADQLSHTAQLESSKERIRQVVEREGKAVQRAQQHERLAPAWTAEDCRVDSEDADQLCLPFRPTRVYTGCDGVMAPRVTEQEKLKRREKAVAKRRKQASANSSKAKVKPKPLPPRKRGSDQSHKELKLVNTYDQHANHSHVSITSGDHRAAGALMSRDSRKLRLKHAQQRIGLVDGAPWIRSRLCEAKLDFDAIGLDFYHFAEHVHQATREVFGDSNETGDAWAHELLRRIREQGYDAFLDKLTQTYRQHRGAKRKALGKLIEYAAARREMLDYPRFIANRWHIGSGPTEAACKHIPRRLKQSGMRWDRPGTDAITNLAALKHNHQWNTYWNQAA